jgi:predicted nucleotidyltransferase
MSEPKNVLSIEETKDRLSPLFKEEGLQLVLMFGSVVSGMMHKKSDIDLAFLFDRPVDILELTNRIIRLLHTNNVDVIDLKNANPLLRFSAARNGRILYEKLPGVFNEFCSLAFRMYVDTKKLRDAQAAGIRHFLEERGLL